MKKYFVLLFAFVTANVYAQVDLNKAKDELKNAEKTVIDATTGTATKSGVSGLSEADIAAGLKEALTQGSAKASKSLSAVDGFYKNPKVKIPFPDDVAKVAAELRKLGYGSKVDEFEATLNKSAEQAAVEAAPIFKSAITGMNIKDASKILTGADTAATAYLRKKTYSSLYNSFSPHITKALADNNVTGKWTEIANIYNKIPFVKKVNPDLVSYTTNKALKGVFTLIAEEEGKIRKNPVHQTSDILKKVFGQK